MSQEKKESSGRNYLIASLVALIFWIPLTRWWKPDMIPMDMADIWNNHGTTIADWLLLGLPIFVWGVTVTFLLKVFSSGLLRRKDAAGIFIGGTLISIFAGVTEEIAFRWLLFFGSFLTIGATNWAFFGFLGFGLPEWFFTVIWGPLASFTTFGHLEPWLSHPSGWLFGAALLSSNAFFRNGHKYLGPLGYVNSWFLGMFFFYVMFTHGLLAAIFIHFLYDFLIFSTSALITLFAGRGKRRAW